MIVMCSLKFLLTSDKMSSILSIFSEAFAVTTISISGILYKLIEVNLKSVSITLYSPVSQNERPRAVALASYAEDDKITKNTIGFTGKNIRND